MVVGFNHNFRYQGEVYHIQTEDSGLKSPNIVTLLYQGGTILASKKTSYADIARVDNLEQVVEELMKEQHKNMLRSLKSGEFDAVIERFKTGKKVVPQISEGGKVTAPPVVAVEEPAPVAATPEPPKATTPAVVEKAPETPPPPPKQPATEKPVPSAVDISLDEVILSYLMGDDK